MADVDLEYREGRFVLTAAGQAVDLPQATVERLLYRCSQALATRHAIQTDQPALQSPMVDVLNASYQTASDGDGHPMVAFSIPPTPPMRFRFTDEHLSALLSELREMLDTPLAIRKANRPN